MIITGCAFTRTLCAIMLILCNDGGCNCPESHVPQLVYTLSYRVMSLYEISGCEPTRSNSGGYAAVRSDQLLSSSIEMGSNSTTLLSSSDIASYLAISSTIFLPIEKFCSEGFNKATSSIEKFCSEGSNQGLSWRSSGFDCPESHAGKLGLRLHIVSLAAS